MPIKSNQKQALTLKSAFSKLSSALVNAPMQTLATRLMYIVLLVAFLVIGYLLGKVETLQKGATTAVAPSQPGQTAPQQPQAPSAPDPEKVKKELKVGHLPVQGDENAKVTMIEFSDFECPFCGRFYSETLGQIKKEYIDTGKVKLYYRHYPLSFHPKAVPLANASECANDQGAFWKMHDKIFDNSSTISTATDSTFKQWAVDLGLNASTFNSCYDAKTNQAKIDEDFAAGGAVGVSGTPTFYINGKQLVGAQPFAAFKAIIDEELK